MPIADSCEHQYMAKIIMLANWPQLNNSLEDGHTTTQVYQDSFLTWPLGCVLQFQLCIANSFIILEKRKIQTELDALACEVSKNSIRRVNIFNNEEDPECSETHPSAVSL